MIASARWSQAVAIGLPTGFALALYLATAAPGLTWAHFGADGGDLLAAAATGGVPHPPGYPLYTLLLQGWLALGHGLAPSWSTAYLGNLFSVVTAALSVGVTVRATWLVLPATPARPLAAAGGGLLWAVAALPWSQALITEVYALHGLIVAALGLLLLSSAPRPWRLGLCMGLGLSHHVTSILLWPALLYALGAARGWRVLLPTLGTALGVAALLYARVPLAAAGHGAPPPVNWGYAVTWDGFWWLVSGAAYRDYVFSVPWPQLAGRAAAAARILVDQFTPLGAAVALIGLAVWEQAASRRRWLALLWVVPISLYAVGYNTVDSHVYLMPVVWLAAVWGGLGLHTVADWLTSRLRTVAIPVTAALGLVALTLLLVWRAPQLSLRHDAEANEYLQSLVTTLEPRSLVITRTDAATFTLWYGVWAGDAFTAAPNIIPINDALYPYAWYRQLLAARYPDLPRVGDPLPALIAANQDRPIFFADAPAPTWDVVPTGPLWRLAAPTRDQP